MSQERRDEIRNYFHPDENHQPEELYRQNFINWSGPRSSQEKRYSEFIAEHLLERSDFFDDIDPSRRSNYIAPNHDGVTKQVTKRSEEIFAKSLLGHHLEHLGEIIDYQVPLKSKRSDSYGKIDLVSISKNSVYLIELKLGNSETLLRAALEIETYARILDPEPFKEYLGKKISQRYKKHDWLKGESEVIKDNLPEEIKKAVLIAVDVENDLPKALTSKPEKYKNLRKLLNEYDIEVYTMNRVYPVIPFQL